MAYAKTIEEYLEKHPSWSAQLEELRTILSTTPLTETIKWGAPAYLLDTKILIGIGAFKNHLGLWFHQGVFLKDPESKLVTAQEKTKALRQWRFEKGETIASHLVSAYINESIENCKAGKEIKPIRRKGVEITPYLKEAFLNDVNLKKAFKTLSEGKQREYADYIATAKREDTKMSRLQKISPMILNGQGLYDKYKNC